MERFLQSIGNLFKDNQQIPMNQSPSIVKLAEGEDIITNNPSSGVMSTGPQGGLFGNNPIGGVMSEGPSGGMFGEPAVNAGQHPNPYMPQPLAQPVPAIETVQDSSVVVPPVFEESSIPPEQNETIKDLGQSEEYKKYMSGLGDGQVTIADYEEVYGGYEDKRTNDPKKPAFKENGERVFYGTEEDKAKGRNRVRRKKALLEGKPIIDTDIDPSTITPEEASESEKVATELTTPQGPDQVPYVDTEGAVKTPNGGEVNVTASDVNKVKSEDPSGWAKAMSWANRTFGITGQDLNRFALLYVGSRIAGYDHKGSMSWSFGTAAEGLVNRESITNGLAGQGKYTPASVEEYRKTGDVSKLKAVDDPKKGIKYDRTIRKYKKGTTTIVHEATLPNGSKTYVDLAGKEYTGDVVDPDDGETRTEQRETSTKQTAKIMDQHLVRQDKDNPYFIGSTAEDASVVEDRLDSFRREHGVDIDSGLSARIVGNASRQAERWAAATGGKVESLAPFIDAQLIYMDSNNGWSQQLRSGGKELNPDQIFKLNDKVLRFAMSAPGFDPSTVDKGAMLNTFMQYAWDEYEKLPTDKKNQFNSRDGFYTFLNTELGTSVEK